MIYVVHHAYCFPRFFASREAAEGWIADNLRPKSWRDLGSVEGFWRIDERAVAA